ncbi:MAG: PaaI family thioesterase [Sulfitobacter sp.]|nr:PaaI family thioesterase [Sulfitobacter sp.]
MSEKDDLAQQFISALPHARALGLRIESLKAGEAVISMPYSEQIIGDPVTGVVHGGAVSALMDTTCGAAVMSHPSNPSHTATIDLRIEYLRGATPGQTITTRATCYHVTRSVAFVRATAWDEDPENIVANVTGTFTAGSGK